jgi:hypothetical protein
MLQAILLSVFSILLWGFSFVFFLRYLGRRTGQKRILAEFREEVDLIVEGIDEAADRNLMMVEERMKSLRALVDEADRRIGILTLETERRRTQERLYTELGKKSLPAGPLPESSASLSGQALPRSPAAFPEASRPFPQADAPAFPVSPAPQESPGAVLPAVAASPAGVTGPGETAGDPKTQSFTEQVAELHREGLSSELIALRLGAPKAKVDLAVTLAKRKNTD